MPAPITSAVSPPSICDSLTACSATETASSIAASANPRDGGSLYTMYSGTVMYSANAPALRNSRQETPTTWRSSQRLTSPRRQNSHLRAIYRRIEGDAVARRNGTYLRAHRRYDARGLVPHDDRRNPPAGRAVVAVNIAAADAARRHLDQYIVRPACGNGNIFHCELLVVRQGQCIHLRYCEPRFPETQPLPRTSNLHAILP